MSDTDRCPNCGSKNYATVEIRGLYDGGLFFECFDCRHRWHRFPEGHRLRAKAQPYVEGDTYR